MTHSEIQVTFDVVVSVICALQASSRRALAENNNSNSIPGKVYKSSVLASSGPRALNRLGTGDGR